MLWSYHLEIKTSKQSFLGAQMYPIYGWYCLPNLHGHISHFHDFIQKQPSEVFYKKGVLKSFAKISGKHLHHSFFCNKVAVLRLWRRCFSVNFAKFLRIPFLHNTCSLRYIKLTASVKKSSHQMCSPCFLHLLIYVSLTILSRS